MTKKTSPLAMLFVTAFSVQAGGNGQGTMVVTATRFQEPLNAVLAPVSVVTREEIDRWQSTSVNDVLRRLPGVDIAQNGGIGQLSSVFIRGTESRHVLVLVDGIRLNLAGVSGSADLSQFPVSLVQRIEYIRGPRSAVYGSDAIGGVINIITTRNEPESTLSARWGSNSYQNYAVVTRLQPGDNTRVTLMGNYEYTKGFDVVARGNTGNQPQPERDGYLSKTLYGGLEHHFSTNWSGFIRGYGYDNRTHYDAYFSPDSPRVDTRKLYSQTWDAGLRFNGDRMRSQLISSYSHSKDYNYDPEYGQYDASAALDEMRQYNIQWSNSITVGHGNVGAGVDWQKQSTEPGTGYVTKGYEQRNTGLYLTGLQQWGDFTFEGAARSDDNSWSGHHGTWQTSAAWEFMAGYRFIASWGTSYKMPNLGQIYGLYGNKNLNPERGKQWEGALEGLTHGVNWRVSGYRNDIDDLIDYSSHLRRYYNGGRARIKGAEVTATFDTGSLEHSVSYDYVDARNAISNVPLPRRAKQQVKYQLDGQIYDFDWSLMYRYLGVRYDTDYTTYDGVKMGGVSLWDITVSYPIISGLTVRVKIANLFDKNYETAYGYQTAGREYSLSGSYTF